MGLLICRPLAPSGALWRNLVRLRELESRGVRREMLPQRPVNEKMPLCRYNLTGLTISILNTAAAVAVLIFLTDTL